MSLLENKRVLVVEDTTIAATYLARELTNLGAQVAGLARSEEQAVAMTEELLPELILMDIHLADGGSGIEAVRQINEKHNLPVVYTTSFSDDTTLEEALETSPYGYIVKPFDAKTIKVSCETALKRFEIEQKLSLTHGLETPLNRHNDEGDTHHLASRLEKRHNLSSIILEQLSEGVAIIDKHYRISDANRSLGKLLCQEPENLPGQAMTDFGITAHHFETCIEMAGMNKVYRHKIALRNDENGLFPAFITMSCLQRGGEERQFVLTVSDISDLSRAERKLEALAFRDPLTNVGNRNYMKLLLDEVRFSGFIQSLVFIDLDGFKQINDRYGHEIGDALLIACAKRLKSELRETDTLIRHGGDEFVVLVQESKDVLQLTERMLATLAKPYICQGITLSVTASIGIADLSGNDTPEELLKRADIAMYEAKKQGKNQTVQYSENQETAIEYRLLVEQSLITAIKQHEFYAIFQPIVNRTGDIVALEALCRWRGNDMKNIEPETFIPVAEETGMITPLGLKMLREVCIARSMLEANGLDHIKIHLNVSLAQLNSPALVKQFVTYFEDFNVEPSKIVVEISERAIANTTAKRIIDSLVNYGFSVALDDFGHGLVALTELTDNAASMIKFDGTWLAKLDDPQMTMLVETLVTLNKRLGKQVLFEGIENPRQAVFADEMDADLYQGFLFGRPKGLTEIIKRIAGDEQLMAF